MSARRWWYVEANKRYIGKVEATAEEMRDALGPYLDLRPNGEAIVWGRPSERGGR